MGRKPTLGKQFVRKGCGLLEIELEEADLAWARQIGNSHGPTAATRAVHYVEPRAGQVQMRLVMALPAELDAAAHRRIATEFCVAVDSIGMPYLGVIHVPTGRNHKKNHHIHLIAHPAECRRDAAGQFDLAGRRKLRPGEIAECLGRGNIERRPRGHKERAADDLHALRTLFATITNAALDRAGVGRRYDPRSYAEMGIAAAPTISLGTAGSALVAAGVDVDIDRDNARKTWAGRKLMLANRSRERRDENHEVLRELAADGANGRDVTTVGLLTALSARYEQIEQTRDALDLLYLQREMANSAAVRLQDNTVRLLGDIDAGRAERADEVKRPLIAARQALAVRHLEEIAQATEPYEAEVASVRAKIEKIEAEAEQILVKVRLQQLWRKGSVLASSHPARLPKHEHFNNLIDFVHSRSEEGETLAVHVWREGEEIKTRGFRKLDEELLAHPHFKRRATLALETIVRNQARGVGRLLKYVEKHGLDGINAFGHDDLGGPAAVRKLLRQLRTHPLFQADVDEAQHRFEQSTASKIAGATTIGMVGKARPSAVDDAKEVTQVERAVPAIATGRDTSGATAAVDAAISQSPAQSPKDQMPKSGLPTIRTGPVFEDFDDDELRSAALARRLTLLPGKNDSGPGSIVMPEWELAKLADALEFDPTRVHPEDRDVSTPDAHPVTVSGAVSQPQVKDCDDAADLADIEANARRQAYRAPAPTSFSRSAPSQREKHMASMGETAAASTSQNAAAMPPVHAEPLCKRGKKSRRSKVPKAAGSSSSRTVANPPIGKGFLQPSGLGCAPSRSSTTQRSHSQTFRELGELPGGKLRKGPKLTSTVEAPPGRDVLAPAPTNSSGRFDAGQHDIERSRVSTADFIMGSVAAAEPEQPLPDGDDAKRQAEIEHVLAALACLSFLPLRSVQYGEDCTIRHVLIVQRAVPASRESLRMAEHHQADGRVQQVFAQKFRRMLDEALLELTERRDVKPDGRVIEMFRNDLHLRSAVNAADGTKEFNEMLDQAREFWKRLETSGATRPEKAITTKESSAMEISGVGQAQNVASVVEPEIDAEYLLHLDRYRRGLGR